MCNHKIYSCGIFILNGSLVIQNIFHDESHIEAQESVVKKNAKKISSQEEMIITSDIL